MRSLKWLLLLTPLAAIGLGLLVYSWTFTPHGRLDLPAAIIARVGAMTAQPLDLEGSDVAALRKAANDQMGAMLQRTPAPEGIAINDVVIPGPGGGIRLRSYHPDSPDPVPGMLWIHGGGFWMGNRLEDWDGQVGAIARDAGVAVYSVDYRLAPEHPWPAAVEDSYAALLWLHDNGASHGVDVSRLAVGGVSAGGNLAAVTALKARDEGGPAIAAQILDVPATDATDTAYPSETDFAEGYVLTAQGMDAMTRAYLPNPEDRRHPLASPLLAESLAGLPPALVITAQYDPLRDEGEAYGEKLRAAGVPVQIIRYDGAIHGLIGSQASARDAHRARVELLRSSLL